MSIFTLTQSPKFVKSLQKLDRSIQRRILASLLALTLLKDPTLKLKPLRKSKTGLWRLRVGDYRVIVAVESERLVIIALDTGHRSKIYEE